MSNSKPIRLRCQGDNYRSFFILAIEDAQVQEALKSAIVFAAGIDAVIAEHAKNDTPIPRFTLPRC